MAILPLPATSSSSSSISSSFRLLRALATPLLSRILPHNRPYSSSSSSSSHDPLGFTVHISTPFQTHLISPGPSQTVHTSSQELLRFFSDMFLMRKVELAADQLYKAKLIRGFCHLYDGQEAICVGMEAALTRSDCIITGYRDHCTFMARGGSVLEVFAELMGRRDGCSLGKGGSMHFYRKQGGFYGGHGIVGAQTALGAGLAFAQKYEKAPSVSLALYGDGAANQGQLFESLNIAALWNLPIIYICENNHYGMGTPEWRGAKSPEFYKRGHYVPGLKVDGMDALAVKQAITFAKEYALEKGPLMVEMDTYRYHGHSMSDPGSTYRTRDEINEVRANRDPIEKLRNLILDRQVATAEELKRMEKEIKAQVDEALSRAKEGLEPNPAELFNNIHVKGLGTKVYGCDRKNTIVMLD